MNPQFNLVERERIFKWSQESLWDKDIGKRGREYLFDKRKISESTAKTFCLGYVPKDANNDLCDRIIFPVFDASNHLIAISSRLVDNNSAGLSVYWHEKYNKSFYLYGINITKDFIRSNKYVIVAEGTVDVLQFYDKGITNVVGLLGSSVSDFQIALLLRYCEKVIFIFDNDENKSGEKAAKRVDEKLKQLSGTAGKLINYGFVKLTQYKDPDEQVKNEGIITLLKDIKAVKKELIDV